MEETFIDRIKIIKVHHLEGLEIRLSDTERKHLILTGRNGSGKTSVLEAINKGLYRRYKHEKPNDSNIDIGLNMDKSAVFMPFAPFFFDSKRNTNFIESKGPQKIPFKYGESVDKINPYFVQHLVNLRYDRLDFKDQDSAKEVETIDTWFNEFTSLLKEMFDDNNLEIQFNRADYNFYISIKNHEVFSLNQLSDGYRAVLDIVSELLMRSAGKAIHAYDLQGIVLIDEIETHLHIDLQKKILPFLTSFFPKIQFIVTTHSPFVLSSVDNAVIYDLEKQIRVEDLSGYSVEGIIESYFDNDKYSKSIQDKIVEFEVLMAKPFLTEKEKLRIDFLEQYFDELPDFLSPELQVKIQQIQLAKLV